jgi:hypothetical protein
MHQLLLRGGFRIFFGGGLPGGTDVPLPRQVGNPEARDAAKHSAVFVLRSALAAVVPTAGVMLSAHYDKRGAKIAIQYSGEDCSAMKDRVQEECTKICKHQATQRVQHWRKIVAVFFWCRSV